MSRHTDKKVKAKAKVIPLRHLDVLSLTETERLTLLRLAAEIRAHSVQGQAKQKEAEEYIRSIDSQDTFRKLLNEAMGLNAALRRYVDENNRAVDAAGKRLGIDLRKFTYDTDTGILHELQEAPTAPDAPK